MAILLTFVAGMADIFGGLLPFHPRFRNISARYVLAFASGIVISAAIFELLPQAHIEANWALTGVGFFLMYLIDKGLALHQCEEDECEVTGVSWITVAGMASDNIIDGLGIVVAFITSPALGLVVTLAVVAHEIPQGISTTIIMRSQQYSLRRVLVVLIIAGAMYPIGGLLSSLIPDWAHTAAIAFVSGVFIYIGAAALMNEAHRRFNRWVVLMLMVGAGVALGLRFLE